jgi:hypothetical protein
VNKQFTSPQTESVYQVVADFGDGLLVCYRQLDNNLVRVRLQVPKSAAEAAQQGLPHSWGELKGGDHYSVVVKSSSCLAAVTDALGAAAAVVIGE